MKMPRQYHLALIISVLLMGCPHQAADKKSGSDIKHIGDDGYQCKVTKVIDGDTLKCEGVDGKHVVRLIGINAPDKDKGALFYDDARNELQKLAPVGTTITLNFDRDLCGYCGRILAYVYNGERDVNLLLIQSGWAKIYKKRKFKRSRDFKAAESKAKKAKRGSWQDIVCIPASGAGKKYHRCNSKHIGSGEPKQLTLPDAKKKYKHCRKCFPKKK